ncbi:MAG: class I SAM-dependent methyltransferase [Myxococcales bacterium]|nr:class I SAM-dependent methyltransferase [Myxococcales bacterium]
MRELASLIAHAELPMLGPLTTPQLESSLDALPPVSRAVDLGAGRADVALRVHERFGATVIAIERSDVLAAEARRRVAGRVTVIEGDAREELAKLRSLDLAIVLGSTGAFEGWWSTLDAIAHVPTWLVGDLVTLDASRTEAFFGPLPTGEEVAARCEAHGPLRARLAVPPPQLLAYERTWARALRAALEVTVDAPWADYAEARSAAFEAPEALRAFEALGYEAFVVG